MSRLVEIIRAQDPEVRDQPLEALCAHASLAELMAECAALERFRHASDNLYAQVRALFFLYALHRFHLPRRRALPTGGVIPYRGYQLLCARRFEEAIEIFLHAQRHGAGTGSPGATDALSSALASAYRGLGFQRLTEQVRRSVRAVPGNHWMFRTGHAADFPLRIRAELRRPRHGLFPILHEATPVRMDLSHCACSDIFFLGMDYPQGARVLNVSIDLCVHDREEEVSGIGEGGRGTGEQARDPQPRPPVEAFFRVIDEPLLRLVSVDLETMAEITQLGEVFDYARDHLGLLKAAVIAAGLIPPGLEGSAQPLGAVLEKLVGPGRGIEVVSQVNRIPKGSRLAVSTSLLACLISTCMRATHQLPSLTGGLGEADRRLVAARAILGEWLGGSGGGWQDSGGVWPGIKLIEGVPARPGDPEFGISHGCLLPRHRVLSTDDVSAETRQALQASLVLVHGGMGQDVGPILEMVTERYLLRSPREWSGRQQTLEIFAELVDHLRQGDIRALGRDTERNFRDPLRAIIPWSSNLYTEILIQRVRQEFGDDFWGFWMLGGMAGGGMGFLFAPAVKARAQKWLRTLMEEAKAELEQALPFATHPVVYDFRINERGSWSQLWDGDPAARPSAATPGETGQGVGARGPSPPSPVALMPRGYYTLVLPQLVRASQLSLTPARRTEVDRFASACRTLPDLADMVPELFDRLLPAGAPPAATRSSLNALLEEYGFDAEAHRQIRADLRSGRIGLAQNRLPVSSRIQDVAPGDVADLVPWFSAAEARAEAATADTGSATGSAAMTAASGAAAGVEPADPAVGDAGAVSRNPAPTRCPGAPSALLERGIAALREGRAAVVCLAGGAGSRWTRGAGVVKALSPFCELGGRHRSFIEIHLAKGRRLQRLVAADLPHIITTSYLTDAPIRRSLAANANYGFSGELYFSPGRHVGLRLVPTLGDLHFAYQEAARQTLDAQAQKLRQSRQAALVHWARQCGEATDYTDNLPLQCLHPVGHWYEVPNLFVNGVLARILEQHPRLQHLMVHNIDTVGAHLDPVLLARHMDSGAALTFEVITRRLEDRGGGLARVDGRLRLVEGLALPREEVEFDLSYYNSSTTWVDVDQLLDAFGLRRDDLAHGARASRAVRQLAARMPTYVTLKEVKKRWGRGQEDVLLVTQFEKLWGDLSALPGLACRYVCVPRERGQQLKEVSQLDGWLRDGSAAYVEGLCAWG